MAERADGALPEAIVCELVGCSAPTRHSWVKRGLLEPRPRGCRLLDAIELLVLSSLMTAIGPRDTNFVWEGVRAQIRETLPTSEIVDVVVDLQAKRAIVAQDLASVGTAVRTGRPVQVLSFGDELRLLREDFQRLSRISTRARGPNDKSKKNVRALRPEA